MKILHAAETIKGGVATVLSQVAQGAATQGHQVAAVIPADHAEYFLAPNATAHTFTRTGRNPQSLLAFATQLWRQLRTQKPDILHLHSTFAGVMGRLLVLPLKLVGQGPKVVYCPHGWAFFMAGSAFKQHGYACVERLLAPLADAIICVCGFEKHSALQHSLPEAKLHVVYNGVPLVPEVKRPPLKEGKPLKLLFVGRLSQQKGFDTLVNAMRLLPIPFAHLTVLGDGPDGALVTPADTNITLLGWRPAAELTQHMAHADVLVMPSRWEGFPMVALEGMSHGLPIVAANVCSMPEAVEHGTTGLLVAPENVQALANALKLTPLTAWRTMGSAARQHFSHTFTQNHMLNGTLALYQTVQQ